MDKAILRDLVWLAKVVAGGVVSKKVINYVRNKMDEQKKKGDEGKK